MKELLFKCCLCKQPLPEDKVHFIHTQSQTRSIVYYACGNCCKKYTKPSEETDGNIFVSKPFDMEKFLSDIKEYKDEI